jgi:phage major head subunit gpT-like protein
MAAPSALRANYTDLFGAAMLPVLEELFRSAYSQSPMIRNQIFKTVAHDRDIWQYSELHDMPQFSQVAEGQPDYTFNRPKPGPNKTLTPVKFGLGYSISEETVDDGKFDIVADAIRKMAESAHESQEQSAMNILNNGFSTETVADGLSLFNSAHTTPSGSITIRNKLSSPLTLLLVSPDDDPGL